MYSAVVVILGRYIDISRTYVGVVLDSSTFICKLGHNQSAFITFIVTH